MQWLSVFTADSNVGMKQKSGGSVSRQDDNAQYLAQMTQQQKAMECDVKRGRCYCER